MTRASSRTTPAAAGKPRGQFKVAHKVVDPVPLVQKKIYRSYLKVIVREPHECWYSSCVRSEKRVDFLSERDPTAVLLRFREAHFKPRR